MNNWIFINNKNNTNKFQGKRLMPLHQSVIFLSTLRKMHTKCQIKNVMQFDFGNGKAVVNPRIIRFRWVLQTSRLPYPPIAHEVITFRDILWQPAARYTQWYWGAVNLITLEAHLPNPSCKFSASQIYSRVWCLLCFAVVRWWWNYPYHKKYSFEIWIYGSH